MNLQEAIEAEGILNSLLIHSDISEEIIRLQEIFKPIFENEKHKEYKRQRDIKTSYNNFVPHREVMRCINAISNSMAFYEQAKSELSTYDRQTQDILHALELTDLSDSELTGLMKELQQIRIFRRLAKNFKETIEPLQKFAHENKDLIKKLGKIQSEIVKITDSIQERKYHVREKSTLKQAFEDANHMYERMERLCLLKSR